MWLLFGLFCWFAVCFVACLNVSLCGVIVCVGFVDLRRIVLFVCFIRWVLWFAGFDCVSCLLGWLGFTCLRCLFGEYICDLRLSEWLVKRVGGFQF